MKVLITGGTGFVGKHFLKNLTGLGWEVALLTRKRSNVPILKGMTPTIYEGDVADPDVVARIVSGEKKLDAIFHLAASLIYFSDRETIERFNVGGTQNMLRIAEKTGVTSFVYASSIEAAGGVREDQIPALTARKPHPISPYGWSKVKAEAAINTAAKGRFKAAILRIGNVYGSEHLNFITFIAESILLRSRMLEFLPYYSDRYIHPVHNQDVTDGLLAAHRCPQGQVTATLAGEYATIGRIFDLCSEVMGKPFRKRTEKKLVDKIYLAVRREYHRYQGGGGDFITYMMAGPGRYIHRAYSLDELQNVIGYVPKYSLIDGIRESLAWARSADLLKY
jgi:dihydroflavonol-4-reductase